MTQAGVRPADVARTHPATGASAVRSGVRLGLAAALVAAICGPAIAAEGGASHYLPGAGGDMLLAAPPAPGLTVANTLWFQTGSLGRAVLEGRVEFGLDLDLALNLASASYTFETPVLGGAYTMAAMVPFGYADLSASLTRPGVGRIETGGDSFALSDIALIPVQLNWSAGPFSFKASQAIIAPTGAYDVDRAVNLGRNYWSFDTAAAVTWFDPEGGREVSLAPGIMFNTENTDTNYRTGTEFHLDFTATQFVSESFAVGLRGYWYQQITGDSGAGAVLGDFKSESVGLGLGFLWTPPVGDGRLSVLGKWMHDVHADNRFESDYFTLTGAWKF
jgi:hypothetical protein